MISDFSFSKDTIGFMIEGKVTSQTIEKLNTLIIEKLDKFEKINLYLEDANVDSVSIPALLKEMEFKVNYASHFNKVAIVTNRTSLKIMVEIEKLIAAYEIEIFACEDRLKAMNWISEH